MQTWIELLVRVFFGGVFVVSGANKLIGFLPEPELPQAAGAFLGGLAASGYFFPLLAIVEVVCGGLILARRFVPLALVVLAPIVVHIAFFHVLLAPAAGFAALFVAMEGYLAWRYRHAFAPLVEARTDPAPVMGSAVEPRRSVIA